MANNPNVNKVIYGNTTVMDISDTTATEGDVVSGKTFYKASGAKATGSAVIPDISNCYQTTDTAETDIQDADYFPFYDTSAGGKRKSLWSNIKAKLKAYFDTLYYPTNTGKTVHEIVRESGTVSAGGTVRIPASGTDSRISTANTCVVTPICQAKTDGTPYNFSKCEVSTGYATITVAEAVSNIQIGVQVINY